MSNKTKIQLGAIAVLVLIVVSLLLAQKADPDFPPFWGLKRVQEKVFFKFKSNASEQVDYMRGLLNIRLEELSNQVRRQSYNYILPSALRYSTLAGQITDTIIASNMKDQVPAVINQFKDHQKVLQDLYVIYPKNTDNWEWKYIQDDVNYLKIYLDRLKEIK